MAPNDGKADLPLKSAPRLPPSVRGTAALGRRLAILWEKPDGGGNWYCGSCREYNKAEDKHLIRYDDGDQDWYVLGQIKVKVLDAEPRELVMWSRERAKLKKMRVRALKGAQAAVRMMGQAGVQSEAAKTATETDNVRYRHSMQARTAGAYRSSTKRRI